MFINGLKILISIVIVGFWRTWFHFGLVRTNISYFDKDIEDSDVTDFITEKIFRCQR